jgi:hypothetical protein
MHKESEIIQIRVQGRHYCLGHGLGKNPVSLKLLSRTLSVFALTMIVPAANSFLCVTFSLPKRETRQRMFA